MQHGKLYFLSDICKLGLGLSQVEHVCISSSTQARNLSVFQTKALVWKTDMFSLVLKTKYKHVPPPPPDSDLVLDASRRSIKIGNWKLRKPRGGAKFFKCSTFMRKVEKS